MSIVLRLDVPALERLLAGDTEVEVSLRTGIVQEFAKRHLVAVLKDKEFKAFLDAESKLARHALETVLHDHVGKLKHEELNYRSFDQVYLREDFKAKIEREVEIRLDKVIQGSVEKCWNVYAPRIDRIILARLDELTNAHVKKLIQDRLSKLA